MFIEEQCKKMIYEEIFREFEKAKVRYLFVGGVAINLYGYVRLTMDLDIMAVLSDDKEGVTDHYSVMLFGSVARGWA
jgi:hypothetical protein